MSIDTRVPVCVPSVSAIDSQNGYGEKVRDTRKSHAIASAITTDIWGSISIVVSMLDESGGQLEEG